MDKSYIIKITFSNIMLQIVNFSLFLHFKFSAKLFLKWSSGGYCEKHSFTVFFTYPCLRSLSVFRNTITWEDHIRQIELDDQNIHCSTFWSWTRFLVFVFYFFVGILVGSWCSEACLINQISNSWRLFMCQHKLTSTNIIHTPRSEI